MTEQTKEKLEAVVTAAENEYTCAKCSCKEPLPHQGRTIDGATYCIKCSLELTRDGATNEIKEESAGQQERIETQQEKLARRDRSRRWKIGLLAASLALVLIEAGLLVLTKPAAPSGDQRAKIELSSTFMVSNALERFRSAEGSYPVILEQLVPVYWNPSDQSELQNYIYLRTARDRFLMERVSAPVGGTEGNGADAEQAVLITVDDQTRFSELFARVGPR